MPGEVTIDFGIDLGTTNSAIAVFHNGAAVVIKSPATNADVTPSAVTLAGGREWVGAAAKTSLQTSSDHSDFTFFEFKRNIGTAQKWPLADGTYVTPEELSTRVLRTLIGDAGQHAGADVTAAVVTVPAAFDTSQIAATRDAAKEAGLSHVETLQEPIAAALAYGFDQSGDGVFLVFDFGGGTFDAALMQSKGGIISVIDHRGDNDLGGGKWDTAIVEQLLVPRLASQGFAMDTASDRSSRLFKLLKVRAETARIELSRDERSALRLGGITDHGERPLTEVIISIDEFESLAQPIIRRSLDLTKELLQGASVSASSISKLILVGGPTRTPALRRAVEGLGIEVAMMVDPMTVVARGAAVYAASRTRPVAVSTAPPESAVVQLIYDAMVEADKSEVDVGLRLEREPAGGVASVRIIADDGSWDSGNVVLDEGTAIVPVTIIATGTANFKVTTSSADGAPIPVTPANFSVTRAVASAAAPLNHSIGVGVDASVGADVSSGSSRETYDRIIERGSTMPIYETKSYRTTRAVSPGDQGSDPIRLHFLEGESPLAARNLEVGEILISGDQITRPLPANSEVQVVLRWEEGQDPHASAYIPFLDQQFSEVLDIQHKQLPDVAELEKQVADVRDRIGSEASSGEHGRLLQEVDVRLEDARRGDAASAHSAAAQLGPLLDRVEESASPELAKAATERLDATIAELQPIVNQYGSPEEKQVMETLIQEARGAASSGSHRDVEHRTERIEDHYWRVVMQQPAFWVEVFKNYTEKASQSSDPVQAGSLVEQGQAAIDRGDVGGLIDVVRSLGRLFPDSGVSIGFGIRSV